MLGHEVSLAGDRELPCLPSVSATPRPLDTSINVPDASAWPRVIGENLVWPGSLILPAG